MIAATPLEDLPAALVSEIEAAGLEPGETHELVRRAVAEDLPGDDVTSWATISPEDRAVADLVARADGVVAGLALAELVFRYVVPEVEVSRHRSDGDRVAHGDVVLTVTGSTSLLLTAERTALNLLSHLSGIATATAAWVNALDGTGAQVRDTRKTIPGLRHLQKYAVRCGGGTNHRTSLSDMALVKDNHVLVTGGVVAAYQRVRAAHPDLPVQVEVTTLDQLDDLLAAGCTDILLDNMNTAVMAEAVRRTAGRARLEASGGLTLDRARWVAHTGVDFVAVGALTHSAPALDIAMDLRDREQQ